MPAAFTWTPKRVAFCEEYLVDLNAAGAARRAGYGVRRANEMGHELLAFPSIRARIDQRMAERVEATRIKAYKVLEELAVLAFSSLDHYTIDDDGHVVVRPDAPGGAIRAVSKLKRTKKTSAQTGVTTIETELHLWDKGAAITNALKHLGLLKEVVEHRDLTLEDMIRDAAGGEGGADASHRA